MYIYVPSLYAGPVSFILRSCMTKCPQGESKEKQTRDSNSQFALPVALLHAEVRLPLNYKASWQCLFYVKIPNSKLIIIMLLYLPVTHFILFFCHLIIVAMHSYSSKTHSWTAIMDHHCLSELMYKAQSWYGWDISDCKKWQPEQKQLTLLCIVLQYFLRKINRIEWWSVIFHHLIKYITNLASLFGRPDFYHCVIFWVTYK